MTRSGTRAICKHGAVVRGPGCASAGRPGAAGARRACRASATNATSHRSAREPGAASL